MIRTTRRSFSRPRSRGSLTERFIRNVLAAEDPQLVVDRSARIVLLNAAAERAFSRLWSEIAGESADVLIPRLRAALPRLQCAPGNAGARFMARMRDSTLVPVRVHCRMIAPARRLKLLTIHPVSKRELGRLATGRR